MGQPVDKNGGYENWGETKHGTVGVQVVVTNGLKFLSRSWISLERAEILSRSCSLSTITAVLSLTIVSWLS